MPTRLSTILQSSSASSLLLPPATKTTLSPRPHSWNAGTVVTGGDADEPTGNVASPSDDVAASSDNLTTTSGNANTATGDVTIATTASSEDSYYFGFCSFCGATFATESAFDAHVTSRCLARAAAEEMNATTEMSGISFDLSLDELDVYDAEEEEENRLDRHDAHAHAFRDDVTIGNTTLGEATLDEDFDDDESVFDGCGADGPSAIDFDFRSRVTSQASSTEIATIHSDSWEGNWSRGGDGGVGSSGDEEAEPKVDDVLQRALDQINYKIYFEDGDERNVTRPESDTSDYVTASDCSSATQASTPATSPVLQLADVFVFDCPGSKDVARHYIGATYL